MPGTSTVYEFTADVRHHFRIVEHPHAATVCNIRHMSHFHILREAIFLKLLPVGSLYHHGHSLLRLADCKFGRIKTAVFGRNPVQIYVKTRGKLSDGYTYAACSEIVGLLDEFCDFRATEQPLKLSLFRGVTLLDLTSARLDR